MAKQKKNPYEGKGKIYIDGKSVDELGQDYIDAVIIDGFIRSMYKLKLGKPGYAILSHFEYTGIDCEKYRKKQTDVGGISNAAECNRQQCKGGARQSEHDTSVGNAV